MKLQDLLKRVASRKSSVLTRAHFDDRNVSEDVRGQVASSVYKRLQRVIRRVMRVDYDMVQDTDGGTAASLQVGGLSFVAKALSAVGNLYTLAIIKDAVVVVAVNEQQLISFGAVPDAGAWSLTFSGQTTSSLAFGAAAATVQSALNALSNLSAVTVSGDYTSGFTVTFAGADGAVDQPLLVVASNTLTASAAPVTVTPSQTVMGVIASDSRSVLVDGYDIKIHCISAATNTQVKTQVDASLAAALIDTAIESGQGAVSATAVSSAEFSGGY